MIERPPEPATTIGAPAADPRFRRLLGAKLCADIAENALAYALLIAIVRRTGSGIHSTLLVVAFTLPAIIFGLPAGVIADRLPKRPVLLTALVLRIALIVLLYRSIDNVWRTYAIIFVFAALGQVFGPVWIALLPQLVGVQRLSRANALLNFTQLGGQVLGVVILAPILLKTVGDRAVFLVAAAFLVGAIVMSVRLGALPATTHPATASTDAVAVVRSGLLAGWRVIDADDRAYAAVVQLTIVTCILKNLLVLFPYYTRQVLAIAPGNTVYVAAPAALGVALGLLLSPPLGVIGRGRLATAGFVALILALGALATVNLLRPFIADHLHLGLTGLADFVGVPPIVTTATLFAVPLGLGVSLNLVAARTVLNERLPAGMQARAFATQNALANVAALVPLFITGALTSLIGARPVMLGTAVIAAALPVLLTRRRAARRENVVRTVAST